MAIPTASIPRFLLPRGQFPLPRNRFLLRPRSSSLHLFAPSSRNASKKATPGKPLILEKPEKFNPPSHGRRLPRKKNNLGQEYGPKFTAADEERMRTKQYPNMMAPEGTRLHWFLNNKTIHVIISLGVLFSLALGAVFVNFHTSTPYRDLLPSGSSFFSTPLASLSQFIEVYKMHTAYISAQTAEKRKKKVEDVKKRAEYRKAHGLDTDEGVGGWTYKSDGENAGPAMNVGEVDDASPKRREGVEEDPRYYVGEDGVRRRRVKKWFGIWE